MWEFKCTSRLSPPMMRAFPGPAPFSLCSSACAATRLLHGPNTNSPPPPGHTSRRDLAMHRAVSGLSPVSIHICNPFNKHTLYTMCHTCTAKPKQIYDNLRLGCVGKNGFHPFCLFNDNCLWQFRYQGIGSRREMLSLVLKTAVQTFATNIIVTSRIWIITAQTS